MRTLITLGLLVGGACADAAGIVPAHGSNVSASGQYVPVNLDRYATNRIGVTFPVAHVMVGGVPFDLVTRPGADNLFLKSAEWPDWKQDPSSYYADYDNVAKCPGDARRPMFKIPVADYSEVCLLAAAENDRALSQTVSFRIGAFDGPRRTTLHDFSAVVPRFEEKRGVGAFPVATAPTGNIFLVRVPLGKAFAQDFKDEWAFDLEVTKELRLAVRQPDPCRFQFRPLGLPSGVHIFGMTFVRAPVRMEVASDEPGHVFNEPQTPVFHVRLSNLARKITTHIEAVATDYYGDTNVVRSAEFALEPFQRAVYDIRLPVKRRGYHELTIKLMSGRQELLRRETTFALLPRDTRRYRNESPFGTWDFSGGHYTPDDPDVVGPLYVKAGLRYGMFGFTADARRKYGVLAGNEPRNADLLVKAIEKDPLFPKRILIFHEHAISGAHVMRTPDVFTGRSPYTLDETEQRKLDAMWKEAIETAQAARRRFPDATLAFGNGNPHLLEEFLRRQFPRELFDSRGNECGSFMRMPETQPPDFVANNAGLWMDRQILDHYGYADKPITQCYEICYPNTNPGNLTLRTQASYFVRHILHSLAWGVPIIRPGSMTDMGNSYYFSNWGASGFCFAKPDVRPKPSYVAMATLTLLLDGAKFSRVVPTGSATVYAAEFRKRDGRCVTALWTLRGTRPVGVEAPGEDKLRVTDIMGNETAMALSAAPIFVQTRQPIARITPGKAVLEGRPKGRAFVVSPLARLADWRVEAERSRELEWHNFDCPRRKGDFAFEGLAEFEGEKNVLQVAPKLPAAGSPFLPMYSALVHRRGVAIPGEPTEIGLMVNGNGGWGRIIFELEDAGGQRWTSIGAAQGGAPTRWMADWMSPAEFERMKTMSVADWNTNDPWQRSRINFEGWRYLRFPLPGNYPGERYHWPGTSQWRHTGDGVVRYPLRFTRLIVELPEKVLRFRDYAPVPRQTICLKDLMVTYAPPEQAFVAE